MVESLVITLREGIEAALVVGIILAYLRKTDNLPLARSVYTGLALAIFASIVAAILFQALNVDPENEYLEGALFGAAGILVATMVVWMWRTAANVRRDMERRLKGLVGAETYGKRQGGLGLLLFTFVMVFREGVETVLFLFAATLGEFDLLGVTGSLLGLALAAIFAVLLIKGSVHINLARFFSVTSFILLLLALRLLAGSVHEFAEVGVLPMSKQVMAFIGVFVRDSSTTLIMTALLAAPILMIIWDAAGGRGDKTREVAALSNAERRKQLAAVRRDRTWRVALVAGTFLIISAMASTAFAGSKTVDPAPLPVVATGDAIRIPLANLPEGQLQKFAYDASGAGVRFIAMRHADGSVHVGLDACQICGSAGYMQEGEFAICKNCNAPIQTTTIGDPGGCNPLPLQAEVRSGELVVPVPALLARRDVFAQ